MKIHTYADLFCEELEKTNYLFDICHKDANKATYIAFQFSKNLKCSTEILLESYEFF